VKQTLTKKQENLYKVILDYFKNNGFSPTLEELKEKIKIKSLNTVVYHLSALEKKGYIRRQKNAKRNIEIIDYGNFNSPTTKTIPVFASVGCDDLSVIANEHHDEFIEVDSNLVGNKNDIYAVRAVGDSMNDAGIENGDYILVEKTEVAENGEKVVAIVGDMVTVKKLERKGGVTVLWPESKDTKYRPIILQENFKIAGKVICTIPGNSMDVSDVVPISQNY